MTGFLRGTRFGGTAADDDGSVLAGQFVLIGPAGVFLADDGRTGASHPDPGELARTFHAFLYQSRRCRSRSGARVHGAALFDPTLLNARKIEETEETFWSTSKRWAGDVSHRRDVRPHAGFDSEILFHAAHPRGQQAFWIKRLGAAVWRTIRNRIGRGPPYRRPHRPHAGGRH